MIGFFDLQIKVLILQFIILKAHYFSCINTFYNVYKTWYKIYAQKSS